MSGDDHSPTQAPGRHREPLRPLQGAQPGRLRRRQLGVRPLDLVHLSERDAHERAGGRLPRRRLRGRRAPARRRSCPTTSLTRDELGAIYDTQLAAVPGEVHERPGAGLEPHALRLLAGLGLERRRSSSPAGSGWTRNYYHYPGPWIGAKPGFMNGGGFPMRFADLDGTPIDVYQQNTNMTDESTTNYPDHDRHAARQRRRRGRLLRRVRREHAHRQRRAAPGRRGDRRVGAGAQRAGDLVQAAARRGSTAATRRRSAAWLERRHAHVRDHRRRRRERPADDAAGAGPGGHADRDHPQPARPSATRCRRSRASSTRSSPPRPPPTRPPTPSERPTGRLGHPGLPCVVRTGGAAENGRNGENLRLLHVRGERVREQLMRLVLAIGTALITLVVAAPALAAPPPPGLVAAYAFDEGSGTTAVDATGNGQQRRGRRRDLGGGPLRRRRSRSTARTTTSACPRSAPSTTRAFTLEAWVQKSDDRRTTSASSARWTGNGPMLWVDHLASRYHLTLGSSLSTYLDSGVNPIVGQWQHLAATFDGTTARYYVDGAEVAIAGGLGQRRQLEHLADRRLRQRRPAASSTGSSTRSASTTARSARAEIQADRDQPLGLADPGAPTTPGNLTVTGSTPDVGLARAGPRRRTTSASPATRSTSAASSVGTTTATSFTVTGSRLLDGLQLEVEAFDAAGNSSPRAAVNGSTTACDATPGLVAAYAFDEGSGAIADDASGNGRNGDDLGRDLGCRAATAAGSRSTASTITSPSAASARSTTPAFTLEAWVQKSTARRRTSASSAPGPGAARCSGSTTSPATTTSRSAAASPPTSTRASEPGVGPVAARRRHVRRRDRALLRRRRSRSPSRAISGSVGSSNAWRIGAYGGTPGRLLRRRWSTTFASTTARSARARSSSTATTASIPPAAPPDTTPPIAPGTLTATPGAGQVGLSWGAATDNVGVVRYNVHRSTSAGLHAERGEPDRAADGHDATPTRGSPPASTTTRSPPRTPPATSARPRTRRVASVSDTTPPSAPGHADRDRRPRAGVALLGRGDRQRRRRPLQRPPLDDVRLHAVGGEPDRAADRARATRTPASRPAPTTTRSRAEDAAGNVGPASNQASAVGHGRHDPADRLDHRPDGRRHRVRRRRRSARPRPTTSASPASSSGSTASTSAPRTSTAPYELAWDTRARAERLAHA